MIDDIPSVIDQLVGKNCGKYADMYNEYKHSQKELALYKKALELACESFTQFMRENGCKDYDFKEVCLNKAKEKIDE